MAIHVCAINGQWEKAVALARETPALGVPPSAMCYDAAVKACEMAGQREAAASLIEEKASALLPSEVVGSAPPLPGESGNTLISEQFFLLGV